MTYVSKVDTPRIEDEAVTTQKLADGAVTALKSDLTEIVTIGDTQTVTSAKTFTGGLTLESSMYALQTGDAQYRTILYNTGGFEFGDGANPTDTTFYRQAPGRLETTGEFGGVLPTAGTRALTANVSGDSFYRFMVQANGLIEWGDGASPADANLYRPVPGELRTDTTFTVGGQLTAVGLFTGIAGMETYAGIKFLGSTGTLNTRQRTDAVTNIFINHGRNTLPEPTYQQNRDGYSAYGDGTNPVDTFLYRSAASTLKTDGNFVADGNVALGNAITDLIGLYGVAAVAQAAAINPPAAQGVIYNQADVQSIADAVDDIRTVLAAIGITA